MTMIKQTIALIAALSLVTSAQAQTIIPGAGASGTVTSVGCPNATITKTGTCAPLSAAGTSGDVVTASGSNNVQDSGTALTSVVTLTGAQTLTNKTLTSPTLTTPALGTPSALVLTNATGLVASTGTTATGTPSSTTYLRGDNTWATPSGGSGSPGGTSGQIQYNNAGAFGGISTTGSGNVVLATSPSLTTPALGAATATTINGVTIPSFTDTVDLLGQAQTITGTKTFASTLANNWGFTSTTGSPSGNEFYLSGANTINVSINGSSVCAWVSTGLNACAIGQTTGASGSFTTLKGTSIASSGPYLEVTHAFIENTAPTVASGFCTSPTVTGLTGSIAFSLNVGTSCSGNTTGVLTFGTTSVGTDWSCHGEVVGTDNANFTVGAYGTSTSSVTVNVYSRTTGLATTITPGDAIQFTCAAY